MVKGLNHPVRVKALTILSERTASPKEISEQLDIPLSNASYHVRVLDELGLIEVVEEERVRGSVAHFYRVVDQVLIDNPNWKSLDPRVRSAISGHLLECLISDAASSLAAEVFDRRDDRHVSRTPLKLDEKGWRSVCRIQAQAVDSILKEQAAAIERLNDSGGTAIHAIVGMVCFEVLPGTDK
ncbi:MAG TPA: winged helix-turn-helix domain-containing protein [Solirubrobacterales bacterium]